MSLLLWRQIWRFFTKSWRFFLWNTRSHCLLINKYTSKFEFSKKLKRDMDQGFKGHPSRPGHFRNRRPPPPHVSTLQGQSLVRTWFYLYTLPKVRFAQKPNTSSMGSLNLSVKGQFWGVVNNCFTGGRFSIYRPWSPKGKNFPFGFRGQK